MILEALRNGRETVREVGFDVPSAVILVSLSSISLPLRLSSPKDRHERRAE
ncbi:MAG: hypothetical protein U1E48_05960 [Paracoccaceae bacterium]